jgi:ATP-dependent RNA helicase DDX31/DBP7
MPGCEEEYTTILKEDREVPGSVSGLPAENVLKGAFGTTELKWEETATELQLDIERWTLASPDVLESARKAFKSHIRAYATHVKDERQFFNIKDLHLGHLAKAFGLRDRPGNVNVPGMRSTTAKKRAPQRRMIKSLDVEVTEDMVDIATSRKTMEAKAKMINKGVEEFNLA